MKVSFLKSKEKGKCFLALDVGTEAAKGLIFKREGGKRIILGAGSQYYDQFGVWDSIDFKKDVFKKAISKVIEEAQQQAKIKTNLASISPPANILRARIAWQSFKRENPKVSIGKKEEKEICRIVFKDAQKRIAEKFARDSGILSQDIQFIETKILETKIDGYVVPAVLGYSGKNLDFKILATFSPKYYFEDFEKIIKDLNVKVLKITHEAQSLIGAFGPEKISAIFLDVGGDLTQVFLMREGKLDGVDEFRIGGRAFSQVLSEKLGLSEEEARILKERYSKEFLSEKVRQGVKQVFSEISQHWFSNLKLKLGGSTSPGGRTSVLLFGGGSLLPEIKEILEKENWEIKFIYPHDLKNVEDKTERLTDPKNTPLLLIS